MALFSSAAELVLETKKQSLSPESIQALAGTNNPSKPYSSYMVNSSKKSYIENQKLIVDLENKVKGNGGWSCSFCCNDFLSCCFNKKTNQKILPVQELKEKKVDQAKKVDDEITRRLEKEQSRGKSKIKTIEKFTESDINELRKTLVAPLEVKVNKKLNLIVEKVNQLIKVVNKNSKKLNKAGQELIDQGGGDQEKSIYFDYVKSMTPDLSKMIDSEPNSPNNDHSEHLPKGSTFLNLINNSSYYSERSYMEEEKYNKEATKNTKISITSYNCADKAVNPLGMKVPGTCNINMIPEETIDDPTIDSSVKLGITPEPPKFSDDEKQFTMLEYDSNSNVKKNATIV